MRIKSKPKLWPLWLICWAGIVAAQDMAEPGDYGDAPDGQTAGYRAPFSAVVGRFPTLYNTANSRFGQPGGHTLDASAEFLGETVSIEVDANDPQDPDTIENLIDDDFDDGLQGSLCTLDTPPVAPKLVNTALKLEVSLAATAPAGSRYINVLIDRDNNGEWRSDPAAETEWVVVDYPVDVLAGSTELITLPEFKYPLSRLGKWMRVALTRNPIGGSFPDDGTGWDGSGVFDYGEIEDFLFVSDFAFAEAEADDIAFDYAYKAKKAAAQAHAAVASIKTAVVEANLLVGSSSAAAAAAAAEAAATDSAEASVSASSDAAALACGEALAHSKAVAAGCASCPCATACARAETAALATVEACALAEASVSASAQAVAAAHAHADARATAAANAYALAQAKAQAIASAMATAQAHAKAAAEAEAEAFAYADAAALAHAEAVAAACGGTAEAITSALAKANADAFAAADAAARAIAEASASVDVYTAVLADVQATALAAADARSAAAAATDAHAHADSSASAAASASSSTQSSAASLSAALAQATASCSGDCCSRELLCVTEVGVGVGVIDTSDIPGVLKQPELTPTTELRLIESNTKVNTQLEPLGLIAR